MCGTATETPDVLRLGQADETEVSALLAAWGLRLQRVADGEAIPGSYWGDDEAGLAGESVLARADTPLHSVLHEACHAICMTPERRAHLDTDAGGDYEEENAVCYLQILLADSVAGFGRQRALQDMDAWGYSFRLGSAARWFAEDADDARAALQRWGILDAAGQPTKKTRAAD